MIEYRSFSHIRLKLVHRGEGKIPYPSEVQYLYADGKELESILKNAPFLADSTFGRINMVFRDCEATAAALAFNYTEIEVKPFVAIPMSRGGSGEQR